MRTTVNLDIDVVMALHQAVRGRGVSFKEALNSAIRAGLSTRGQTSTPYRVPSRSLGLRPHVNIDKAPQLSADLEDDGSR